MGVRLSDTIVDGTCDGNRMNCQKGGACPLRGAQLMFDLVLISDGGSVAAFLLLIAHDGLGITNS